MSVEAFVQVELEVSEHATMEEALEVLFKIAKCLNTGAAGKFRSADLFVQAHGIAVVREGANAPAFTVRRLDLGFTVKWARRDEEVSE